MVSFFNRLDNWFDDLSDRFRGDNEERRREERDLDNEETIIDDESTVDGQQPPKILGLDYNVKQNAVNHNCEKFELTVIEKNPTPIIRRGGTFFLSVKLNQEVNVKTKQLLKIYFNFGSRPSVHKGTQAIVELSGKVMLDNEKDQWDVRVDGYEGNNVDLEIQVPHSAPVGVWQIAIECTGRRTATSSDDRQMYRDNTLLYILFNPWNKDDAVYMEDEEQRQEYILNDVGKIWVGGYPRARGRQWVFGQFDDAVLPACILLLERSSVGDSSRGDPIAVCRAISRIVNSNDDSGVVTGRWDGKYEDGTAPSGWTGSIAILEEYMKKNRPVKYGQCWVFSGVTTTVCRALGIPSRSVTNLNSAHDTNNSLTIDNYYDKNGEELKHRLTGTSTSGFADSIWNFHVWNDVWMTRPDLPSGYGGWQAIDATPQETSHGFYQCGPASLEAVRRGQVGMNYDVGFVLAEVNADLVKWQQDTDETDGFKKLSSDKNHVGRELLTKKLGKMTSSLRDVDRHNCTTDYKAPEGTTAERITLHTAASGSRAARHAFRLPSMAEQDCEFSIVDIDRVPIGEDFDITITIKNKSDFKRTVNIVLGAVTEYYTGVKGNDIKKAEGRYNLEPGQSSKLKMTVDYDSYFDKLVEYSTIKMVAIANVVETSQSWIGEDKFQITKPDINVEINDTLHIGVPESVSFSFHNPLKIECKKCSLIVDGPGLTRPKKIPIPDIKAKSEMIYKMKIVGKRTGTRNLIAAFNSDNLVDLTGSADVLVLD